MTIMEMLQQSVFLTVLGMAVVFVFLWLMIVCMVLTANYSSDNCRCCGIPKRGVMQDEWENYLLDYSNWRNNCSICLL